MKTECFDEYQLVQGYRCLGETYRVMLMDFLRSCIDIQAKYEGKKAATGVKYED